MNEPLNNTETLSDRKLETISAISILAIVLSITAYILYYCENKYRDEYYAKEKGFTTINKPDFNGLSGEYPPLKEYAQQTLAFPKSYKHIETIYIHGHNHQELFVQTIFSGKTAHHSKEIFCLKASYSRQNQPIKHPTIC